MKKLTVYLVLLGVAIALMTVPVQAAPLSYSFEVTATTGPLSGTTATGTFTFDSNIIPLGGGNLFTKDLFTDLSFTWHGISYDESTANTGKLGFDASGNLTTAIFGNNCFAGACIVNSNVEEWFFATNYFVYSVAGINNIWDATVSFKPATHVPEPTTILLLGLGIIGLAGIRRKL